MVIPLLPPCFARHFRCLRAPSPNLSLVEVLAAPGRRKIQGSLMVELLVAMAILAGALLPLALSFASERRYSRATYQHAVAMEIVDGEIETLAAGEWRAYPPGGRLYKVNAGAATNLPPGRFLLTISQTKIRLEWLPSGHERGGASVAREVMIR
jgi:hypothetical protein